MRIEKYILIKYQMGEYKAIEIKISSEKLKKELNKLIGMDYIKYVM